MKTIENKSQLLSCEGKLVSNKRYCMQRGKDISSRSKCLAESRFVSGIFWVVGDSETLMSEIRGAVVDVGSRVRGVARGSAQTMHPLRASGTAGVRWYPLEVVGLQGAKPDGTDSCPSSSSSYSAKRTNKRSRKCGEGGGNRGSDETKPGIVLPLRSNTSLNFRRDSRVPV